jgi:hypothetical protein
VLQRSKSLNHSLGALSIDYVVKPFHAVFKVRASGLVGPDVVLSHSNLSNSSLPVGLAGLIGIGIITVLTAILTSSPPFTNSLPMYPEISLVVLTNCSDCLLPEQSYTNPLSGSTLPTNGAALGALLVVLGLLARRLRYRLFGLAAPSLTASGFLPSPVSAGLSSPAILLRLIC